MLVSCVSGGQPRNIVGKFKQSEVGEDFLLNHSEKNLKIVLAFLQDPVRNFRQVQGVADVCSYIYAYANYLTETRQTDEAGYLCFLSKHFQIATDNNVPVLTYLVLSCHNAFLSEGFADQYSRLFGMYPEVFIKDLRQRANWKRIVYEGAMENWQAFNEGLAKLGNSGFERELKD